MHIRSHPADTPEPVDVLTEGVRRRAVMRGGALLPVGAGVVMLSGCGQDEEGSAADSSSEDDADQEESADGEATSEDTGGAGYPTSEVPVGGTSFDEDANIVYSQPSEGEFRAFDATCPHQGCAVSNFADGRLVCPCHNSQFDPDSGDVLGGPATSGLTSKDVTVSGDELIVN
ncbi:MAG: Rieske (2Fe-2S) protein [Ornithinimicrobium sp.]